MTNKTIKLPAAIVKAACLFQAKGDHREYLNAIYLDKKGCVVATNGHILIKIDHDPLKELKESLVVRINGAKLPKKAKELEFIFLDKSHGVVRMYDWTSSLISDVRSFELIDMKYTNYKKAIPKTKLESTEKIGINPKYMDIVGKAQNELIGIYNGVSMEFRGKSAAIVLRIQSPEYTAIAVVMPMRL